MKFVAEENGRTPEKTPPWLRFVHHETHMEWKTREVGTPTMGGERLTQWFLTGVPRHPRVPRDWLRGAVKYWDKKKLPSTYA